MQWPAGTIVVAITHGREIRAAQPNLRLRAGERVLVLAPTATDEDTSTVPVDPLR